MEERPEISPADRAGEQWRTHFARQQEGSRIENQSIVQTAFH